MLSTAAKKLNIKTVIFSDDSDAPAQNFCDEFIYGKYNNKEKIQEFITKTDIVTYEFENIPYETLDEINKLRDNNYMVVPVVNSSDIILNIQGDEPFIDKFSLKKLIDIFKNDHDKKIDLASLMQPFNKIKDVESSSNVKVVVDNDNFALYFSRSIIPFNRLTNDKPNYFKHIGVYAFKKEALMYFYNSKPSNLEKYEKLEQLRFLENGKKIKMVETIYKGIGIDTMEDLINARKII